MITGRIFTIAILVLVFFFLTNSQAFAKQNSIAAFFKGIGNSGVGGMVRLKGLKKSKTFIRVRATGLVRGRSYLSIYYDNSNCALVSDSIPNDVLGYYKGNRKGKAMIFKVVNDPLNTIHSVSVRKNDINHTLVACASF